jgi:hypothetical protein
MTSRPSMTREYPPSGEASAAEQGAETGRPAGASGSEVKAIRVDRVPTARREFGGPGGPYRAFFPRGAITAPPRNVSHGRVRAVSNHIRSNVVGYVALFIALSGTAYAVDGPLAGTNTVGSADIINGEVQASDIGTSQVLSSEIAAGSVQAGDIGLGHVRSGHVANDTTSHALTGTDIANTNSLGSPEIGGLGSADIADNSITGFEDIQDQSISGTDVADNTLTADDIDLTSLDFQVTGPITIPIPDSTDPPSTQEMLSNPGFSVRAECSQPTSGGLRARVVLEAKSTNSSVSTAEVDGGTTASLNPGDTLTLADSGTVGSFSPDHAHFSAWSFEGALDGGVAAVIPATGFSCAFSGSALGK